MSTCNVLIETKVNDELDKIKDNFKISTEEDLNLAIEIYGQKLLRYCHNILCDYYEAEDAVQITFIKAYNKRKSFKEGTSLSAWLYRIAYTTCIDSIRRKKIQDFFCKNTKKGESVYKEEYISEDLREALLKISPMERALIFSRVLDEKNYSELEAIYKTSAATLRKRYERAKNKLAKELKEQDFNY